MEPSPGDKDDPGPVKRLQPRLLYIVFALLTIASCTSKKKEAITKKYTTPDSTLIKQKLTADSLAKANNLKKKIYLTFDDGPNAGTMHVLEAVIKEQIPASFFIVAKHVNDSPSQHLTWEELKITPGIELCNHSYSHASNRYKKFYRQPETVVADFRRSNDSLHFNNSIARLPGRNAWRIDSINSTDVKESRKAADSLHLAGFDILGWDIEWGFNHHTLVPEGDTALMFRRIDNLLNDSATHTPGHLVLLAHDQSFRREEDVKLLEAVLVHFKNNPEYELRLASQYPGTSKKY